MGGGGSETYSKSGTIYKPAISYIPRTLKGPIEETTLEYMSLPTSIPVSYGGRVYRAASRAPLYPMQALAALYSPHPASQWSTSESRQAPQFQCCFIFLEGEGQITKEVREFRDRHFPADSPVRKGYRTLAKLLVPLMRKSRVVKWLVRWGMTKPISVAVEYHNGKNHYGFLAYPIALFWEYIWRGIGLVTIPKWEMTWSEFYKGCNQID